MGHKEINPKDLLIQINWVKFSDGHLELSSISSDVVSKGPEEATVYREEVLCD